MSKQKRNRGLPGFGESADDETVVMGVRWFALSASVIHALTILFGIASALGGQLTLDDLLLELAFAIGQLALAIFVWWWVPRRDVDHVRGVAVLLYGALVAFALRGELALLSEPGPVGGPEWIALVVLIFPILVPWTFRSHLLVMAFAALSLPFAAMGQAVFTSGSAWPAFVNGMHASQATLAFAVVGAVIAYRQAELFRLLSDAHQHGSYRLLEKIGEGGMGEVWRAEHTALLRPAAVKIVRNERLGSGDPRNRRVALARFQKEARLTARLTSPHTVQLYDFGVSQDGIYYAMELLEGVDLETLVEEHGRVGQERMHQILLEICDSLEEAHAHGLIHRDVKPANIHLGPMGTRREVAKLLDFGLVIEASEYEHSQRLTVKGKITGTPLTMAPEAALGQPLDARADIYSLACTAYFALTGRPVFPANTPREMLLRHVQDSAEPLDDTIEIDPLFEALILECLSKAPTDRPANVAELKRRLSSVKFARPWTDERAREWYSRRSDVG